MIEQLPSVLKEDVYFHQYGKLIESSQFLQEFENSDLIWVVVRHLKKQTHELGDYIYKQDEISDNLYMMHSGIVKIYVD
jgi:CRP-like cAMP-binding protein